MSDYGDELNEARQRKKQLRPVILNEQETAQENKKQVNLVSKYILIQPDEDGNPITWLSDEETRDITKLMEDYEIQEWVSDMSDPNYWGDGKAMLLKVKVANPKPVKVIDKWELPND
jgi:hypothetical protein